MAESTVITAVPYLSADEFVDYYGAGTKRFLSHLVSRVLEPVFGETSKEPLDEIAQCIIIGLFDAEVHRLSERLPLDMAVSERHHRSMKVVIDRWEKNKSEFLRKVMHNFSVLVAKQLLGP